MQHAGQHDSRDQPLLDARRRRTLHWFAVDVREMLNNPQFLDLTLSERGLWFSMMLFYWWRGELSLDPAELARTLQVRRRGEVARSLPAVMAAGYFVERQGGRTAFPPELEHQAVAKEAEVSRKRLGGRMTAERGRTDLPPPTDERGSQSTE